MPKIVFNSRLRDVAPLEPFAVTGATVREALESAFAGRPHLRGYVLDDQGVVRKHVAIYVNDRQIDDRIAQSDPLCEADEVFVLQALSGGSHV